LREHWPTLSQPLVRILTPIATVLFAGLVPNDTESESHARRVAEASAALERWKADDEQPVSAVLRRPPYRMIQSLQALYPRTGPSSDAPKGQPRTSA
jgi:hypothetical protein